MITDEDKEKVRQATDLLQLVSETVELRQRGHDFWGCCPFHHEKSPSFHVIPSSGLWKCFGCGAGGDVFAYVMRRESLDFADSVRYLADRAGIELTEEGSARRGPRRNRLVECVSAARDYYSLTLMRDRGEGPGAARRYLAGRGFGSTVCRRWHLGFAPGRGRLVSHLRNKSFSDEEILAADLALGGRGGLRDRFFDRAMFPIDDEQGRPIGFGGRVLTDAKPKYLNTKDTAIFRKGKHLFAFDRAKNAMVSEDSAIVCEGYTDVISMHEAGIKNSVAALGTALTLDHVKMIGRFARRRIICMFDGDEAGQRAAERTVQFMDKTPLEILCVVLPKGQDPAEFLASSGADALRRELDAARPLMAFVFEKHLALFDLTVPGQRIAALDDLSRLLVPLKDSILLDGFATQVAGLVGTSVDEVMRRIRREAERAEARSEAASEPQPSPSVDATAIVATQVQLSDEERRQLLIERELISLMATSIEPIRSQGDRIATFSWVDPRDEAMAWAMLATVSGTPPQGVVSAAQGVVPEAAEILASGTLDATSDMPAASKIDFLVDMMDLWTSRLRVRGIKARLSAGVAGPASEGERALFEEATEVQRHINELVGRLPKRV